MCYGIFVSDILIFFDFLMQRKFNSFDCWEEVFIESDLWVLICFLWVWLGSLVVSIFMNFCLFYKVLFKKCNVKLWFVVISQLNWYLLNKKKCFYLLKGLYVLIFFVIVMYVIYLVFFYRNWFWVRKRCYYWNNMMILWEQ